MPQASETDHYEILQVSPRADQDTIERVFRHLAKRFHPDNADTGDTERFNEVVAAYRTLSEPEARAAFDAKYTEVQRHQWQIFDQTSSADGVEEDRRLRIGLLTVLYQARRADVQDPGVGILDLERILDCPQDIMQFHIWYLKESGLIERLDTGHLAITVEGVNRLNEERIPWSSEDRRIGPGAGAPGAGAPGAGEPGAGSGPPQPGAPGDGAGRPRAAASNAGARAPHPEASNGGAGAEQPGNADAPRDGAAPGGGT